MTLGSSLLALSCLRSRGKWHHAARALARHYAPLAHEGELDGVRLLTKGRIQKATELQTEAFDEVMCPIPGYPRPVRKALGY